MVLFVETIGVRCQPWIWIDSGLHHLQNSARKIMQRKSWCARHRIPGIFCSIVIIMGILEQKICLCMDVRIKRLTGWKKESSLGYIAKITIILALTIVTSRCRSLERLPHALLCGESLILSTVSLWKQHFVGRPMVDTLIAILQVQFWKSAVVNSAAPCSTTHPMSLKCVRPSGN